MFVYKQLIQVKPNIILVVLQLKNKTFQNKTTNKNIKKKSHL
jgi:hypothetical protein